MCGALEEFARTMHMVDVSDFGRYLKKKAFEAFKVVL